MGAMIMEVAVKGNVETGVFINDKQVQMSGSSKARNAGNTDSLVRYGMQLAMLNNLLALNMISAREHSIIKARLMKDYKITP
jgi:hypothetical protein